MTLLYILLGLCLLFLLATLICFLMTFYARRKKRDENHLPVPAGKIYRPYREKMRNWMLETRQMTREDVSITSFDGLTLRGFYYEFAPGAPIELMFPGYRGDAERDLCGGVQRCFQLGHSALIVDQRACGRSDGHTITFGIRESRDCMDWIDFMLSHFGPDVKIILTGVSMGAATVLIAAGNPLPKNVLGVLADSGYTGARQIIQKVIRQMHLPPKLIYPLIKWGAKIFGGFDLEAVSPIDAMAHCTVPVIFYHGEADDFVPCYMSQENFEACTSKRKKLCTVPGAGHVLCYPVSPKEYLQTLRDFWAGK